MVYDPASTPINQVTLGVPECTVVLVIYYLSLRHNAGESALRTARVLGLC
jgi:hypothetical protein